MKNVIAELERRRVFRVAAAYVVGAWVVLQVADTLFPALRMPQWTVTLVAVAVILGFPLALILGWMFDLTPGGIERTADVETDPGSPPAGRFPLRAATIATILVTLGIASFFVVRRQVLALQLDEDGVLVLPFRVSGDASIAVLREGMVDLLAAKLDGEGGPRALDSRTAMTAWKRAVDSPDQDLTPDEAVRLARRMGVAQVLLGEVVAAGRDVVISATLHSIIDRPVRVQESAPADSLLRLVDRIVAGLLSVQAGQSHRTEALLSESLPAVKSYLDGQRLFRLGRYDEAVQRFGAAVDEDSTFALAALGLGHAATWAASINPNLNRGQRLAFAYRDRLPARDRDFLIAWVGHDYPAPRSAREYVRGWQDFVAKAPDRVDVLYELGDNYYHYGRAAGYEDANERAMEAWSRAAMLDSTFAPTFNHQVELWAARGDTAQVRRISNYLFDYAAPDSKYRSHIAWAAATALDDRDWLQQLHANAPETSYSELMIGAHTIELAGLTHAYVDTLNRLAVANARSPGQKFNALVSQANSDLNRGRPSAAAQALRAAGELEGFGVNADVMGVRLATIFAEADSALAVEQLERLEALAYGPTPTDSTAAADQKNARCFVELWRVTHGQLASAAATVTQLHEWTADTPTNTTLRPCAFAIRALHYSRASLPAAATVVSQLDSVLMNTPVSENWRQNFVIASGLAWQQLGDLERARAALTRYDHGRPYMRAEMLLQRARLAARLGRRDEAVSAYRQYLAWRPDPEPGKAADIVARARAELGELIRGS